MVESRASVIADASLPTVCPYPRLLSCCCTAISENEEIVAAYCIGSIAGHIRVHRTEEVEVEYLHLIPTAGVGVLNELSCGKADVETL